jgi:hypothetical protein
MRIQHPNSGSIAIYLVGFPFSMMYGFSGRGAHIAGSGDTITGAITGGGGGNRGEG